MDGSKQIAEMMENYRNNPPKKLAGLDVVQLLDYNTQQSRNLQTGESAAILLPRSNVLQFILEDGSKISARPSGTEPKIKFYFSVNEPLANVSAYEQVKSSLSRKIEQITKELNL